ncbi:MAG TPA: hypothetical protein VFF79_13870 [Conexibacter sp.]|nr:hypothetical protein [Conexibacter sp.]
MSVADEADPVAALVDRAYECGHVIDHARARSLYVRFGYAKAREHVVLPSRLADLAATELRRELSVEAASGMLAEVGGDFAAACRLMSSRTAPSAIGHRRITPSELRTFAAEYGLRLSASSAQRYSSDSTRDPCERVRSLGRIRDVGSRRGMRIDLRSAATRLAGADGDEGVAVGRIERRARRRRLIGARLCRVRHRTGSRGHRVDAAARCACSRCEHFLLHELERYTHGIVRRRYTRVDADREQDAACALVEALLDWHEGSGFQAFYGAVLAHRLDGELRRALDEAHGNGDHPLSLDAPRSSAGGRLRTWADHIPGYSIDPLEAVILKEEAWAARSARLQEIERILALYEAMKSLA